jgi:thiamine-phosphate pyrophosphorylase
VLAAGADAVLIREDALPIGVPEGPDVFLHARIQCAAELAHARGHGLHLPGGADPAAVRAHFSGRLSQSCHSVEEVRAALAAGVDLVLLSPIWAPGSKPDDARPTLGPGVFAGLRGTPVLALGGVDAARVPQAAATGAFGVAAIGAFFGPDADPAAFVAAVRAAYSTDQL